MRVFSEWSVGKKTKILLNGCALMLLLSHATLSVEGGTAVKGDEVAALPGFALAPDECKVLNFPVTADPAEQRIVVEFRAYAKGDTVSGYRPNAVSLMVNRQYFTCQAFGHSRLLNKKNAFTYGAGKRVKSQWGADAVMGAQDPYRKGDPEITQVYPGGAGWAVMTGPDIAALSKSAEYRPRNVSEPALLQIDVSDLVRAGYHNEILVRNNDPSMTLVFDGFRVLAGGALPWAEELANAADLMAGKTAPTYYTPERIAVARENMAKYDWAKKAFNHILEGDAIKYYIGPKYMNVATFSAQNDEFIWKLMAPITIPRKCEKHSRARCPVHGTKGRRHEPFCPWRIDPIGHPYQIQCMEGGEWYPSNRYDLGDMTSGKYPDDGSGFEHGEYRYQFLSEYAHMAYGSVVVPLLTSFSQAWVLTGDEVAARKGCILLARVASEYPNLTDRVQNINNYKQYRQYGGCHGGLVTDSIWSTFRLEAEALAYDALFSYMDRDPEMLAFLRDKGLPVRDAWELRKFVEDRLIRVGMRSLLRTNVYGNDGHHQAAAMACALVMDDFFPGRVNSRTMLDYYYDGTGNARYLLVNGLTPDGGGHESVSYNRIKFDMLRANNYASALRAVAPDHVSAETYPDIFDPVRGRAIFDYFLGVNLDNAYFPAFGDCGNIAPPQRVADQMYALRGEAFIGAFEKFGDPRFARAATKPDGAFIPGSLFESYPGGAIEAALKKPESRIERKSRFFDDYGLAYLSSGEGAHQRALYLNYTCLVGHRQYDNLSLELVARGVKTLPDLGYPFSWRYRWEWDSNMMSHNTVCVDESVPARNLWSVKGPARVFASRNGVHMVSAAHDPYPADYTPYPDNTPRFPKDAPECSIYERTLMLVDVDDTRFYVVDLFSVNGGSQHDQSWHAMLTPVAVAENLAWKKQQTGTLAGPQVKPFGSWTDKWGRKRADFASYVKEISTAQLADAGRFHWESGLPEGDALNLFLVPLHDGLTVFKGTGRSPDRPETWGLDYLIVRRQVQDGARSFFLTVIDSFQKTPTVQSVKVVLTRSDSTGNHAARRAGPHHAPSRRRSRAQHRLQTHGCAGADRNGCRPRWRGRIENMVPSRYPRRCVEGRFAG